MIAKKILVMGLPGSGKTYFSCLLKEYLEKHDVEVNWYNADEVRNLYGDWDFSYEGRIRQSHRMRHLADSSKSDYAICDFVAPLPEMRDNLNADWTIWIDTIEAGRYEDTNAMFVRPTSYDFRVHEQDAEKWVVFIGDRILKNTRRPTFDWKKETVQMLGRWQPWHEGHRALFERALKKTGQVAIMIRDCQGWQDSNPFEIEKVKRLIDNDLEMLYQGQYVVLTVPNIVNITYGRDVGYKIEQETFSDTIHSISATKIRQSMGLK